MCGIVAYIGQKAAQPVLIEGLKRLAVALEGALKLKEISYIHAEGLPAAEMKHGPIALIVDGMPAVFIATAGPQYEKIMGTSKNTFMEVRNHYF